MHMILFSIVALLQTSCLYVNPMHVVVSLETVLHVGKRFYLYEFTDLNLCLLAPSWSPGH